MANRGNEQLLWKKRFIRETFRFSGISTTIPATEGAPEGLIPRPLRRNSGTGLALEFIPVIHEH